MSRNEIAPLHPRLPDLRPVFVLNRGYSFII